MKFLASSSLKIATVGLAIATLLLAGAPAQAANSPTGAAVPTAASVQAPGALVTDDPGIQACSFSPYRPYQSGQYLIVGRAHSSGCINAWFFHAELQRHRWFGWESLDGTAERSWWGNGGGDIYFACAGTHTYRVALQWNNTAAGTARTEYSGEARFTC